MQCLIVVALVGLLALTMLLQLSDCDCTMYPWADQSLHVALQWNGNRHYCHLWLPRKNWGRKRERKGRREGGREGGRKRVSEWWERKWGGGVRQCFCAYNQGEGSEWIVSSQVLLRQTQSQRQGMAWSQWCPGVRLWGGEKGGCGEGGLGGKGGKGVELYRAGVKKCLLDFIERTRRKSNWKGWVKELESLMKYLPIFWSYVEYLSPKQLKVLE